MTDVTKSNFETVLPVVKEAIEESDFVAIDTELTGLYTSRSNEHAFDTMEDRYMKSKLQSSNFLIIQFGLSAFKYHADEKKYTHKDFNFYVFPRPHLRQSPDPVFNCQTSSLHFLASHGFDFNKVIYEGIPYLNPAQEEKLRQYLSKKYKNEKTAINKEQEGKTTANGQKPVEIPDEHKQFIAEIQEAVDSFMSNDSETVIQLDPCSAYRRKLIYESVQQRHTTGIEMTSQVNEENKRFITIVKRTSEDKMANLQNKEISDMEDINAAVGFRKVMDCLSQSKKLVIGHFMHLDVMHMIEQFYAPLPEDYNEYKSMVRTIFPYLLDTKYLASTEKLKPFLESTHLGDVVQQVQGSAFDLPTIECGDSANKYSLSSGQYHEAGFDAFLAGVAYIALSRKLALISKSKSAHVEPSSKLITPYQNRFYVRQHYDITCINLTRDDPEPNRDNVFYVRFPEEWKTADLVELFLPYGNIYVNWLDDVSALVALKNVQNTISAKQALLNRTDQIYRIKMFKDYRNWELEQLNIKKPAIEQKPASKKRNSDSDRVLSSASSCMEVIPEVNENEVEADDATVPPSKKLKPVEEEREEVSSTAVVFEEDNNW